MHDYARAEIWRLGGPADDDSFWDVWDDGSRLLPQEAVRWNNADPRTPALRRPVHEDPPATHFQRQHWSTNEAVTPSGPL